MIELTHTQIRSGDCGIHFLHVVWLYHTTSPLRVLELRQRLDLIKIIKDLRKNSSQS